MARRARRARGRDIQGILLLDKSAGMTSNAALQEVKTAYQARKAGHTGSLDPIATGLLPICFGEATKLSGFFLEADKHYETVLKLGESTTTGDAEGEVTARRPVRVDDAKLDAGLARFRGEIEQVPPMYSAIKVGGQPLYKLARQGIEVERKPRTLQVYRLDGHCVGADRVSLSIHCSSGFYVRGLAQELGEDLGCGAYVESLRRTGVGSLTLDAAVTLDEIRAAPDLAARDQFVLPSDAGLEHLPRIELSADAAYYLCRGQAVRAHGLPASGWVRLYAEQAGFLGVGNVLGDGRVAPKRLFRKV